MKPILNPASEKTILATVANMPQSLLITGDSGVGLSTAAKYIAQLLNIKPIVILPEKDEKIDLDRGMITVDIMRRVFDDTRTKNATDRIVIIDYAERMTTQAQNAFLKLLEEPGQGLHFILVSNTAGKLLPTILSRVKKNELKPINTAQTERLLDDLEIKDATKRSQLMFMASGLPAELTRLATDSEYFDQRSTTVRDARELLQGKLYQKLLIAQKYKDNRGLALKLLLDSTKILQHTITANPQIDTIKHIDIILKTYERIDGGGNIRLCLAAMVV
ncbi:MAG: AAA family ATPase [Candidatus Saccharibacteria bacterium]